MNSELIFSITCTVLGGLGVFLLGMKYMSEGLQAVSGERLRKIISVATDNRIMGMLVGLSVTTIIQSSSVTTVMVVGLVNSAMMTLTQAIGVIFGANIGTTVTAWILTLKISQYGLPLLGLSAIFFLFSKNERLRYTGMTMMGIGMIFFGLELMTSGFKPLRTMPAFVQWFHSFQAASYFGVMKCVVVGCILTMIVQSSSATIGITMGLASTGMINFETAGALVLGENIGTTITAWLASLGASTNAKRAAYAHICFNTLGVAWITTIALPFYFPLVSRFIGHDPNTLVMLENGDPSYPYIMAAIAAVHTGFNMVNTLIFLPFVKPLAQFVSWIVPEKQPVTKIPHLAHLDIRFLDTPAISIVQSHKQIMFMAESNEAMLEKLAVILDSGKTDNELENSILGAEETLDVVQHEVMLFLGELISGQVPHDITDKICGQMRMADEYESVSDYAASILKGLRKLRTNNLQLTPEGREELKNLNSLLLDYLRKTNHVVRMENPKAATQLVPVHKEINQRIKEYRQAHLNRVTAGKVPPLNSLIYSDLINYYRRINDHTLNIAEVAAGEKYTIPLKAS